MDSRDRQFIETNRNLLLKCIDFKAVVPFLKQEKIFTSEMLDDIEKESDDYSRKLKLLEDLPTRGPVAFEKFISVLLKAGQQDALKCMTNVSTNLENTIQESNNNDNYIENLIPESLDSTSKKNKYRYEMNSKTRGYCIIINNVDFDDLEKYRFGSDADANDLYDIFNHLGYKVILKRNLTGSALRNKLECFSKLPEFRDVDSCVVIILSHGSNGYILGTDGEAVHISEILIHFNNENCKDLIGKPKIFFVQACRGDDYDGISAALSADSIPMEFVENKTLSSNETSDENRIPLLTDIYVSFSTTKGYKAYRDPKLGTWYGQSLCKCLRKFALTHDLSAILRRVDAKVQKFMGEGGVKQATEARAIGVKKDLYFNIPEKNKRHFNLKK